MHPSRYCCVKVYNLLLGLKVYSHREWTNEWMHGSIPSWHFFQTKFVQTRTMGHTCAPYLTQLKFTFLDHQTSSYDYNDTMSLRNVLMRRHEPMNHPTKCQLKMSQAWRVPSRTNSAEGAICRHIGPLVLFAKHFSPRILVFLQKQFSPEIA